MEQEGKPVGRPHEYTPEIGQAICDRIADTTLGLKAILAENEAFPVRSTFYRWLTEQEALKDMYARAKEEQADALVEEMLTIADDHSRDVVRTEIEEGVFTESVDYELVNRSKLRLDTRKWIASKLRPKKYGDKLDVDHSGSLNLTNAPIKFE